MKKMPKFLIRAKRGWYIA